MNGTRNSIALCLYGKFNNRYSINSGINGHHFINEHLLSKFEIDVFIFSTDLENEKVVRDCYGKHSLVIKFDQETNWSQYLEGKGVETRDFSPKEGFRTIENMCNFFFTRGKAINLATDYARSSGFDYKWIIASRFDLGQVDKYNGYQPYKVSEIGFNPKLDNEYIYGALWNQNNSGVADQWFYGNTSNMEVISKMFPECIDYFLSDSSYLRMIAEGIPFSSEVSEFSNEIFRPARTNKPRPKTIPRIDALDTHLVQKHFMDQHNILMKLRGTALIPEVARVLYTHTDYSDCWPIYFGQILKHGNLFQKNYVCLDKYDEKIPDYFQQIIYDDKLSYTERLQSCLELVSENVIFFEHEDMILFQIPEVTQLQRYAQLIKSNRFHLFHPNRFDAIKLVNGGDYLSSPIGVQGIKHLRRILRSSQWIFSIQPSFWSRESFLALIRKNKNSGIWDFERNAQKFIRKFRFRTALLVEDTGLRGSAHFDSNIYPYIATAIVKGKWNLSEYRVELEELAREYDVDLTARGII